MADPLSITAGIIAVVGAVNKVIEYLNDVKNSSQGYQTCLTELSNSVPLLYRLNGRLYEPGSNEAWYDSVRSLAGGDGPLAQYRMALEALLKKVQPAKGLQKVVKALTWTHVKAEVETVMNKIERLKNLIHIALEMDHL